MGVIEKAESVHGPTGVHDLLGGIESFPRLREKLIERRWKGKQVGEEDRAGVPGKVHDVQSVKEEAEFISSRASVSRWAGTATGARAWDWTGEKRSLPPFLGRQSGRFHE